MAKKLVIIGCFFVFMMLVNGIPSWAGDIIVLRLATESAVGTPGEKSGQDFARLAKEKTNGSVQIKYYPAGQLGTGDALTEALQTGSIDLAWRVLDWYSKFEQGWNIMLLGFLFKDKDHAQAFLDSPKNAEFKNNLATKSGMRILSDNGIGSPRVLISKVPVSRPSDLQGLKMRVPNIKMYLETWIGVGVSVVQIPWGEVYMSLKQGVVDAMEAPLGSIYGMKFHEAAKNITLTNHLYSIYVMAINESSFRRLPEDIKKALIEASLEAGQLYVKYDNEAVSVQKQKMIDQGVKFNENPDIDAFQGKLANLAGELENKGMWPQGLYKYVQGLKK